MAGKDGFWTRYVTWHHSCMLTNTYHDSQTKEYKLSWTSNMLWPWYCHPGNFWYCMLLVSLRKCPLCHSATHPLFPQNSKGNLCTSIVSLEGFLLICLPKGVLISTIIQSRLPLSHFPLNPLIMPTSFSKLSWELSFGDFHLCLMQACDARFTQHCSLAVLSVSPEINCTLIHFFLQP